MVSAAQPRQVRVATRAYCVCLLMCRFEVTQRVMLHTDP